MQTLSLTPGQRLGLVDVLGAQTGTLATLLPYHKLLTLFVISESEAAELKLEVVREAGQVLARWDSAVGAREFSIEDSDARALAGLLESWQHFKSSDLAWLLPVRDQLRKSVL